MLRHLFFKGFHPVFPWLAFLLVGMALGRLDLRRREVRWRVLWSSLGVALFAEAAGRLLLARRVDPSDPGQAEILEAFFGSGPMPPTWCYALGAGATACAWIVACVAIGERCKGARWLAALVATGQLALTLYVAHVFVGMGVLDALGRLEDQSLAFAVGSALVFCVASVLFAWAWRARYARGPFEAVMRRLTDR